MFGNNSVLIYINPFSQVVVRHALSQKSINKNSAKQEDCFAQFLRVLCKYLTLYKAGTSLI